MNFTKPKSKTASEATELATLLRDFVRPIDAGAKAMSRIAEIADIPAAVDGVLSGKIRETIDNLRPTIRNNLWKGVLDDLLLLERTLIRMRESNR